MTEVTTTSYDDEKREAVFDLLERVWDARPDPDEFSWWFEQSPAGQALVTLAEDGDRVIGVAAASLLRVRAGEREQLVPMPLQVATDAAYRGRGIFSRLELANEAAAAERGSTIGITYPNDASRPIFLERLGWHELWRGRIWARPPLPVRSRSRLQPLDAIPAGASELDHGDNGQILDGAFLEWRYLRSPRDYRVLGAWTGGNLCGLLAFRPQRGNVAVVAHALGDVSRLLYATRSGKPTVALVPRRLRGAFLRAGFVPTHKRVRVLGKRLRPEGSLAGEWQFQLGDFDVF